MLTALMVLAVMAPDAGLESFEAFDTGSLEAFAPAAPPMKVRPYGWLRAEGALDTAFDSPRNVPLAENVLEGRLRATVGVDVSLSASLRLVLEGRAQLRLASQREFDRAKGFFEPMLGEAYLDVYTTRVDVRVGQQRLVLGANAGLAPADALNPRDLRESFLSAEPEDVLLPVFAVRAQGELGPLKWLAAYVPFFQPHRFFIVGQDEALLQPALGLADNRRLEPSVEDFAQERALETARPAPFVGDVALRLVSTGRFKVGASWVWLNQKMPRLTVDPELRSVLQAQSEGRPIDPATGLSVASRLQAGETLFRGGYSRAHLFSLEGSTLIGPLQLDADITLSPAQTLMGLEGAPLDKATMSWVVGLTSATESAWVFGVQYLGMSLFGLQPSEQVALLEPATARGRARTGWFHLFAGVVGRTFFDGRLEVSARGAFEPIQASGALSGRLTYRPIERLSLWVAGELFAGPPLSAFGYFTRNDRVVVGARLELF